VRQMSWLGGEIGWKLHNLETCWSDQNSRRCWKKGRKVCVPCLMEAYTMSLLARFQGLERLGQLAFAAGSHGSCREP